MLIILAAALLFGAADKLDPRLATARTVFVAAHDTLSDDMPVAACFADHLTKTTPLTAADTKDAADVLLSVRARLPGNTARMTSGIIGQAWLVATLPDGTELWTGMESLHNRETLSRLQAADIPCTLADGLAGKLRQAMRKARDAK